MREGSRISWLESVILARDIALAEANARASTAEASLAEARAEIAGLRAEILRWDREYLSDAEVGGIIRHHPRFSVSWPQQAGTEAQS